jgi:hypothetical protein
MEHSSRRRRFGVQARTFQVLAMTQWEKKVLSISDLGTAQETILINFTEKACRSNENSDPPDQQNQ